MEHLPDLNGLFHAAGIDETYLQSLMIKYANEIFNENKKFNLTGHKNLLDIIENLFVKSLIPVKNLDVPRGTLFADIGTGAGIPGIPIAIKYGEAKGALFDSNHKKVNFINRTAAHLGINNVRAAACRVEDLCREPNFRESFDMVFSRAMSDLYTVSELGAPLLKVGGLLFLYSNEIIEKQSVGKKEKSGSKIIGTKSEADDKEDKENRDVKNENEDKKEPGDYMLEHIDRLGLSVENMPSVGDAAFGVPLSAESNSAMLIFRKIKVTDAKYPRRISAIRRT
ncbi:MAG: 16S rRNA (guanine(527)-N(7))-methyltransferase RsmG, partial [Leptospirales bacterium]|nr:16S rRNA (guanine(527)-N(7))-methyltransferase RsmG [Leptospirales bacterium]